MHTYLGVKETVSYLYSVVREQSKSEKGTRLSPREDLSVTGGTQEKTIHSKSHRSSSSPKDH